MDRESELRENFPRNFFCSFRARRIAWFQPLSGNVTTRWAGPAGGGRRQGPTAKVGMPPCPLTDPNRLRAASLITGARRPASRALVVPAGGVPRSPVKSSRRQTAAWAGERRGRSARCGGGNPDSAGGSRTNEPSHNPGTVSCPVAEEAASDDARVWPSISETRTQTTSEGYFRGYG